jgi:hypothetical protein
LSTAQEAIRKFHEGLLARKKEGFKDIKEEASYLFGQMKNFSLTKEQRVYDWRRLDQEIDFLENHFEPQSIINLFDEIFIINPRLAIFRVFAHRHKDLITKTELNDDVIAGKYRVLPTDSKEELYEVFLSSLN